jgi:hypothetical protein
MNYKKKQISYSAALENEELLNSLKQEKTLPLQ